MNNLLVPSMMRCPKCGAKRTDGDLRAACRQCARKGATVQLLAAKLKCLGCGLTRDVAAYEWTLEDYEAAVAAAPAAQQQVVVGRGQSKSNTVILTFLSVVSLFFEGWAVLANRDGATGRQQELAHMFGAAGGALVVPTFILALIGCVVAMRTSKRAENGQFPLIAVYVNAFVMVLSIVLAFAAWS